MPSTSLSVAHFGHPLLKGAKHWSILVPTAEGRAFEYQISGSTKTYEFKAEEVVLEELQSCMGQVTLGSVDADRHAEILETLRAVPIQRGNISWCCHQWVLEGLAALQEGGFAVTVPTHSDLETMLAQAQSHIVSQ
ncbi:uncharacterized protein LAESUDRAFT_719981 [Laetiporus sulphureus 93-53]|uniref:Uncharacterized protein n=1 Tax=Laetiporus sulphureus 93-53 TaxID=1314785 RepID=A0A165HPP3_9APHY|nr:uncharacterized protein LAESUDRAFT_719981 [Laetiporus sulphureus 93-53]KZT12019.1 hypothetical protein LAESUDRAFT_719981 [Laetiporus sulphureus 93-53]